MKNVIEQIRKIKGVKTVEATGEGMAVVVFEASPKKVAVKCTDQNQFEFVWSKTKASKLNGTEFGSKCICADGIYDAIDSRPNEGMQYSEWFKHEGYKVINFGRYLLDNDLESEWTAFNKPKSLTPEELVDGRIYVDGKDERIFRFNKLNGHKKAIMYSQLIRNFNNGTCLNSTDGYSLEGSKIRCSSIIDSKELIKFEIERDYFHELK